ncbi:MAG: hypothetical protein SYC29_11465 [Planctomycetota bacterium]|nr:hypothetical protein [Planctomycetota bacterium]
MKSIMCVVVLVLMLPLAVSRFAGAQDDATEKPLSEQGYIGLALRDIPDGNTVVSWLFPGPLNGRGLEAPDVDLARPDVIVAVNGEPMNAEQFKEFIRSSAPGTQVVIEYRRAKNRGGGIPDAIDAEDEIRRLEVTLESREEWTGTMRRGRGHDTTVTFDQPHMLDPHDPDNILGKAIAEHELAEPLDTLLGVFAEWQARDDDYHSLSRVRAGFDNPFCLPELARWITNGTRGVSEDPLGVAESCMTANLEPSRFRTWGIAGGIPRGQNTREDFLCEAIYYASTELDLALADVKPGAAFATDCVSFLRVPKRTFYLAGDETRDHIAVIRESMDVRFVNLVRSIGHFKRLSELGPEGLAPMKPTAVPAELAGAVEGEILSASNVNQIGWVVLGGDGPNRYDMSVVVGVMDRGGNDEYYATGLRLGTRVIIDFAGNDHYTGTPEQGPGGALLGVSFIDDRAGDDVYEGELLACGAAMYGVSLLLDRGGNDIYKGSEWSLGAACYGAGMIIDLGGGSDQYLGDFLCEGVGGPRGFGCIIDDNGRDLYRANGPTPSAYGTPAVYQSFSQGVGWGYRNYAAGGIGMISDLGGDDRYEAGEFAQGGAYYYGLGILHDAGGRDLYYGNRYGQGFGVHQAVGILVDDAGDDTYWSMTAASQGAAWDIGVGLLLDRAGNDTYQCDGLGQGGASMQAIGMLIDLAGKDRYAAGGGATQGQSGGNSYHYHDTGAFSFSLLLDLGGAEDHYSRGRANNATTKTGSRNEKAPKNSGLHGLVIDE